MSTLKTYKHLPTGTIAKPDVSSEGVCYYYNETDVALPSFVVENGRDWVEVDEHSPQPPVPARKVKLGEVGSQLLEEVKSEGWSASFDQLAKKLYPDSTYVLGTHGMNEEEAKKIVGEINKIVAGKREAFIRGLKECMPLIETIQYIRDFQMCGGEKIPDKLRENCNDLLAAFPTPDKPEATTTPLLQALNKIVGAYKKGGKAGELAEIAVEALFLYPNNSNI